ncbi:MAG TPA: hypothetical protein VHN78_15925 [Chloroflexota bacterium]|nr:hypothetical protein [Chloroflexota bacterium]
MDRHGWWRGPLRLLAVLSGARTPREARSGGALESGVGSGPASGVNAVHEHGAAGAPRAAVGLRRARDGQRARLYRAEAAVPEGRRLPEVADVQRYVDRVVGSDWWQAKAPGWTQIQVKDGRGRRRAGSWTGEPVISLPRKLRVERIVLHELAHQLTDQIAGPAAAGHGWQYAAIYLALVRHFLGPAAAQALLEGYRAEGVRWTAPS